MSWQRSQRLRRTNQKPSFEIQDVPEPSGDSAAQAEQRDQIERLYAAIRQLSKGDAALVLLYLDDLSYREIAEVLGISESNVGVKLNRAKKSLAELMGDKNGTR
jgi:RNA polymerase sigma-70 factor (ECF subfamily)